MTITPGSAQTDAACPDGVPSTPSATGGVAPFVLDRRALAWWSALVPDSPPGEFGAAWLNLQAARLEGVRQGVLVLGDPDAGPFEPVARWAGPAAPVVDALLQTVAGQALQAGEPVVDEQAALLGLAYPVQVGGHLHGVAAFVLVRQPPEPAFQQLRWGMGVLESWLLQREAAGQGETAERLMQVLNSVARALQAGRHRDVALTLTTDLAVRLGCDRVSLGLRRRGHTRVLAMSHNTRLSQDMNLVRAVAAVMDEAIDQRSTLSYPQDEARPVQLRAHRDLARGDGNGHVLTVPYAPDEQADGALVFERPEGHPFQERDVALCQALALLVGRILYQRHQQERAWPLRWYDTVAREAGRLLGARYIGRKLLALCLAGLVAFGWLAQGVWRVHAPVVVQGVVQRVVAAPFDGYLSTALHRAGDVVQQGDLLATLDTRELALEQLRADNLLVQYRKQADEAIARGEQAAAAIAAAQAEQAQAQVAFYAGQVDRAAIRAPFDGILVSGDLSQRLGEAIKRGQELFKLSPMDDHHLWLDVDNRDVAHLHEGQRGHVVLAAHPDQPMAFTVSRVVPMAQVAEGRTVFRAEARLDDAAGATVLRPGMEGVAKVDVGERRLLWIWTHRFADWVRLQWWRWF